jgi:hypothetical protein
MQGNQSFKAPSLSEYWKDGRLAIRAKKPRIVEPSRKYSPCRVLVGPCSRGHGWIPQYSSDFGTWKPCYYCYPGFTVSTAFLDDPAGGNMNRLVTY